MPESLEAVQALSWDEMQQLFAAIYVDELAESRARRWRRQACAREVAALSEGERRSLREALAELELV
jgi:hypothetical protein